MKMGTEEKNDEDEDEEKEKNKEDDEDKDKHKNKEEYDDLLKEENTKQRRLVGVEKNKRNTILNMTHQTASV